MFHERLARSTKGGVAMTTFSSDVMETFIAPGISAFDHAEIPDMSHFHKDSTHWIANFFLNSVLRGSYKPPYNAYLFNYFRRAEAAFREHELARAATLEFLSNKTNPSIRCYALALFHWEIFLGQSWHAYKLLQKPLNIQKLYAKGSGTLEERLNNLYNSMKHVESFIDNNQMPPGATVPVWLTNDGLISVDESLTFAETAEVLREIAKWADVFADPLEVREKLDNISSGKT